MTLQLTYLNQPRLLGLESPARAGHGSGRVLPAALRRGPHGQDQLPQTHSPSPELCPIRKAPSQSPAGFIATSKWLVWDSKHQKARANRQ